MLTPLRYSLFLCMLLFMACKPRQHATPGIEHIGSIGVEIGQAVMISDQLQGLPTASGNKYDSLKYTGAHRTLKYGSKVVVTNTETGASVTIKIIDRGPVTTGHIIGLSKAAIKKIDSTGAKIIPVRIRYKE